MQRAGSETELLLFKKFGEGGLVFLRVILLLAIRGDSRGLRRPNLLARSGLYRLAGAEYFALFLSWQLDASLPDQLR